MPVISEVTNEQTIRLGVTGADGADALYVINGVAHLEIPLVEVPSTSFGRVQGQETFSAPLGPSFASGEERVVKAIATAGVSAVSIEAAGEKYYLPKWSLSEVDGDFDDEAGRVELTCRVNFSAEPTGQFAPAVRFKMAISFQLMILAARRST